ncbi:accessory Sec system protein Asp2 [Liquorilactobacillus satsumensis]|nr:accessory Sec system protein Asp2 [Liquorilactobacillus satsumensis]MCP9358459.1 accessory Sec system protein Asp2 [Liquorilactobacillus satsumensis]
MSERIKVLQIGTSNWKERRSLPSQLEWFFVTPPNIKQVLAEIKEGPFFTKPKERKKFDVVFFTEFSGIENIECLDNLVDAYRVIYVAGLSIKKGAVKQFLRKKMAWKVPAETQDKLLAEIATCFFEKQNGIKMAVKTIEVAATFTGNCSYQGNSALTLEGNFGEDFKPLAFWRNSLYVDPGKTLEIWPEYYKEGNCKLKLFFYETVNGSSDSQQASWSVTEDQLQSPLIIKGTHNNDSGTFLNVILYAQGTGKISLGALHYRWSRQGFGQFIPGGQRFADKKRQEFLYYFDPGDLKPPLNVYFSGYRSLEGFEGYFMLKKMGAPFLLISDPRLEGGAFYLGTDEFEGKISNIIQAALTWLDFNNKQLILSGISMGTFGALYYGSLFQPHAIIVGKPLLNVGTIAINGKLLRPQDFDTALDLLQLLLKTDSQSAAVKLNQRFWDKFAFADLSETTIAAAYMENDDYDRDAFQKMITGFPNNQVKIIGRGYVGRHNDNSPAIIKWFLAQYHYFLRNDFERNLL